MDKYDFVHSRRSDTGRAEISVYGDGNTQELEIATENGTATITTITLISIFTGLVFLIISLWYFCHKRGKHYLFAMADNNHKGRHRVMSIGIDEDEDDLDGSIDNGDGIKITAIGGHDDDSSSDDEDGNATQVIVDENKNDDCLNEIDIVYDDGEEEEQLFNPNEHQTEGDIEHDDENMTLNGGNRV